MKKPDWPIKGYTAAFHNHSIDLALEHRGFTKGMIVFAVPDFGVLFRCRAQGSVIDLEFGAFFALLRFVKTRFSDVNVGPLQVFSSNPEFVFSFTGKSRHLTQQDERVRLLAEYSKHFKLSVVFVEAIENKALVSPADYPSLPRGAEINLRPTKEDFEKSAFRPFQKGLVL
ncbi:MAG: hypothetical protein ABII79_09110 [bacterium]